MAYYFQCGEPNLQENAYLKKLKALAQTNQQPAHDKEPKSCKT